MSTRNDVTGDLIKSKPTTDKFRANWERIQWRREFRALVAEQGLTAEQVADRVLRLLEKQRIQFACAAAYVADAQSAHPDRAAYEQVADRCDTTTMTVERWLSGENTPTRSVREAVLSVLQPQPRDETPDWAAE